MTTLTDIQRIAEIETIKSQINPLHYEKVKLDTTLYFAKRNYFQDSTEDKLKEIIENQKKLDSINSQLTPLFAQLRQLQKLYWVQYEGELTNRNGGTYWQPYSEHLYMNTDCAIDTTTTPINVNDPKISALLVELQEFLINHRFTAVQILQVKRM